MNVLVIGGTGFIGYPAVHELLRRGHTVTALALRQPATQQPLPAQVHLILADMDIYSEDELRQLFTGYDGLVFAAGADDRVTPRAPAYPYFYRANVLSAVRTFTLARQAGVRRAVLMSSYFVHFARLWPRMQLSAHHPYIRSRLEQQEQVLRVSLPDLEVVMLELPYIFGVTSGCRPLWAPLVDYIRMPLPLLYPRGGTNMIAIQHVAEAVAGALERGVAGEAYLVGDENRTWADLLNQFSRLLGKRKKVITIPTALLCSILWWVKLLHRLQGREGGLDPVAFTRLQTANTYFDPEPARLALGFGSGGLDQALTDTVYACLAATRHAKSRR
ncbi:MAG: NAD(P)H-binding protein [Anaerolineae bacterium]